MKSYSVKFSPDAEKALQKLDAVIVRRIKNYVQTKLEGCENPRQYGKALEGNLKTFWRYRVGDYRIVADIQDDKILILVVDVDKRNDIYNKKNIQKLNSRC